MIKESTTPHIHTWLYQLLCTVCLLIAIEMLYYMFDKFFFFLLSCLCSVCFRNGLCLFVLLSLFYCITIIRSLLLYILMDFSPPSEDSKSLGKLQSIYILHKIAVKNQTMAPLQLAKEHLPGNIVDILERLSKADNIPFNQLYYIVENCADCYYSKVIETFVALLKCQFTDRQLLLVNTARSLKFLEEYTDRQALIWKIFQRHEYIPDDIQDLHFHIDNFKTNIEKEFSLLKEATHKNIENFQSSLNLQQTYSAALCSHINNIYNKLAEIQQQLPHSAQHMNTGDVIQIEVPDFDPDIDEVLPIPTDQNKDHQETQGSVNATQQSFKKTSKSKTPASLHQDAQDVDWPDVIPVEIPPQPDQDIKQNIATLPTQCETDQAEIPQLEADPEKEQSQDLQTYLTHHNTYKQSQRIRREYSARLLELNDD